MGAWLVGRFTFFGISGHYWMLAADAIVLVSIATAVWRRT
jgi:hypothetical protein